MFSYWQHNKNVILAAVALFIVSLTGLLFFLSGDTGTHGGQSGHGDLKTSVVDAAPHAENPDEQKYHDALKEALKDQDSAFIVVKPDGHTDLLNSDYETMTGYHQKDVKDQLFFSYIHPEDLPKIMSAFGKVISEGTPVLLVGPYRMRNANGEYHFHIASLYPIKADDKVEKIGFVCRDITSEIKAKEQPQTQETQNTAEQHQEEAKDEDNHHVVEKLAQLIRGE